MNTRADRRKRKCALSHVWVRALVFGMVSGCATDLTAILTWFWWCEKTCRSLKARAVKFATC